MLYIATVHWKNDRWIDIQLQYLRKYMGEEFSVFAFLDDSLRDHVSKYFRAIVDPTESHSEKLNRLADEISKEAKPNDLIMFLDGDAFPTGDVMGFLKGKLATHPLVAVQRRENNGDMQPHPCFCVTTVGLWRELGGDWSQGYCWRSSTGEMVTDIGGNLLQSLEQKGINWYPVLRTNKKNLHPLFYGVYGDIVYHHGCGFRPPCCRLDRIRLRDLTYWAETKLQRLMSKWRVTKSIVATWNPEEELAQRIRKRNTPLSEEIYEQIQTDKNFHRKFV